MYYFFKQLINFECKIKNLKTKAHLKANFAVRFPTLLTHTVYQLPC